MGLMSAKDEGSTFALRPVPRITADDKCQCSRSADAGLGRIFTSRVNGK